MEKVSLSHVKSAERAEQYQWNMLYTELGLEDLPRLAAIIRLWATVEIEYFGEVGDCKSELDIKCAED